jgi:glutamine amidotransferase
MCRLFGFRSAVPSRAHRSLLEAENALAEQARAHPDGWGIGWFIDDDAYLVKSSSPAHECSRFKEISDRLSSHTFVVHVRRATVGAVDPLNAHPFRFGRWLFAHNGTVHGFDRLRDWMLARTPAKLRMGLLGDTDSEHLFAFLLGHLQEAGVDASGHAPSEARAVAGALRTGLLTLAAEAARRGLDRPTTNVILTDGRVFLAHRSGVPLWFSSRKTACPDAPACPMIDKVCLREGISATGKVNHLLVASEPIGADNVWSAMDDGATVALDADFHRTILPAHELAR